MFAKSVGVEPDDMVCDFVNRATVGNDAQSHIPVNRVPDLQEFDDLCPGIRHLEQGAVDVSGYSFKNGVWRGVEGNDEPDSFHMFEQTGLYDQPAAAGNDQTAIGMSLENELAFEISEVWLAVELKDLGNRDPLSGFDGVVRIHKLHAEVGGHLSANRAFACSHESSQIEVGTG